MSFPSRSLAAVLPALATLVVFAPSANAQTIFTDRTSFSNAAGNLTTKDFTTSTVRFPTFTTSGRVTASLPAGVINSPAGSNIFFSTSRNGIPQVTFTLPCALTAVGVDVAEIGNAGKTTFGYILSNGRMGNFVTYLDNPSSAPLFFGLTDTDSFTSITFTNSRSSDGVYRDNLTCSAANVTAAVVPEPSEWAIMGMHGTSVCGLMVPPAAKPASARKLLQPRQMQRN